MKNNDLLKAFESKRYTSNKSSLLIPIGIDNRNNEVFYDLKSGGSILIGGQTGSGKSIFIHCALASLLAKNSPYDLKIILFDPKMIELALYNGIDHLITPVIYDPLKVAHALRWLSREIQMRMGRLSDHDLDIDDYNRKVRPSDRMPYILVAADEISDFATLHKKEYVSAIKLITNLGPTAGVYLIMTSSGPDFAKIYSPEVRNSFKTKIAFKTSDSRNSRLIIGKSGAEKLDEKGQMLFKSFLSDRLRKLQGFYIDIVEEAKRDGRLKEILVRADKVAKERERSFEDEQKYGDYLFGQAVEVVRQSGKASASLLQRRLKIGYARAAKLLDLLEENGVIGPGEGARPRDVLTGNDGLTKEDESRLKEFDHSNKLAGSEDEDMGDELYEEARIVVVQAGKASASLLQRRLKVGYARAARLLDLLEENGIVGPQKGDLSRKVLIKG